MIARRLTLGALIPTAAAALGLVPWLLVRDDLPDRLASHFDLSGTPDQSMTVAGFLVATGALVAVGALLCIASATASDRMPHLTPALVAFLGGFLAGLGGGIMAGTVVSQRAIDSWRDAAAPWWIVLAAILASGLLGVAAARLASGLPSRPPATVSSGASPVMDLASGERAVWSRRLTSGRALMTAVGLIVGGLAGAAFLGWPLLVLVLSGIAVSGFATIHLRADASGLEVRYGVFPWPRTHIATPRIARASRITVRPREWGGWGYRGSLRVLRRAAVVLRAGPGIQLDLRDGTVFAVTIDEPDDGVALLNAEIARAPALSGGDARQGQDGIADRV